MAALVTAMCTICMWILGLKGLRLLVTSAFKHLLQMIQVIFDNLFCRVTRLLPVSQKVSKKCQIVATLNKINPACLHCNSDKFCPFLTIMTCLSQSIHCFFDEF